MQYLRKENENYYWTSKRDFTNMVCLDAHVNRVFDFAWRMTFGRAGEHRDHRTGGQIRRRNGELFANTFQGKLAEFGIHQFLASNNFHTDEPTLEAWALGRWDETDIIVGDKCLNIKSAAHFSQLLLLETGDWNTQGQYIPNLESGHADYDFHILTRIQPDIKKLLRDTRLFYSDTTDRESLLTLIRSNTWNFNSPGYITNDDLRYLISNRYILPRNAMLNGKMKMDAENYYCQAGDMHPLAEIIRNLN